MERAPSGLRVNSARDAAAGTAITNRMEANLRANSQMTRGINDGISLAQTEGNGLIPRKLAVQTANDTLSDID
ncbi:hypothetical protein GCM10027040_26320 [Halomonas shantousis]